MANLGDFCLADFIHKHLLTFCGEKGIISMLSQKFIKNNKDMIYLELENSLIKPKPIFSRHDIERAGFKAYPYQLNLWVKKGYLKKLKGGLYMFSKAKVSKEIIANYLRQPSYISLEYALYWHNYTVDIPFQITSVTTKNTARIQVENNIFIYYHVKPSVFNGFINNDNFFVATAEKALVDLFYLHPKKFNNDEDFVEARFHEEMMKEKLDWVGLFDIAKLYNNKSLLRRLGLFQKYIFN